MLLSCIAFIGISALRSCRSSMRVHWMRCVQLPLYINHSCHSLYGPNDARLGRYATPPTGVLHAVLVGPTLNAARVRHTSKGLKPSDAPPAEAARPKRTADRGNGSRRPPHSPPHVPKIRRNC
ncbi:hypothetical protein Bcep1808_5684 [Burkholderia vietnamiensis G4]|uniref:Uncharacterized protein n=1 Tax=Burkholderia vietnamiensis (strain G4 / LMG 22486) TaxID=269482 RepID=A4JQR8_BURVG|nr:hypothetical protein Bcep1808_5684 [Burkholderia vietnamiensis G4]